MLDYTFNVLPYKSEKYLIVTKCEVASPALETEIRTEVKKEETGIIFKPKQEVIAKSAAQIMHEQHGNMAPAVNWTINVWLTSKGNMRSYKNARGEGYVFNVELTDEDGTQIQATMFNDAAKKFYDKFELGKVYYISRGTLKVANKLFKTVQNDYEMTLNENSEVEEATGERIFIPQTRFNFVPIDQLGPYVNGKKTVVVSLWNDLATTAGQKLLDMVDTAPIVAVKCLKVGDFQGESLSSLNKSIVLVNPEIPESKKLKSWYESEGKGAAMASVGSGLTTSTNNGIRSLYSDRVFLSHITSNPSLGEDNKAAFFSIKAYTSSIKLDQTMWYRACKTCNKKVTDAIGSGYWCEGCQKNDEDCSLRYIVVMKVSDPSGEAWLSVFNEQAEQIIGCSADELDQMKSQMGESNTYHLKLKQATWVPHLFRVSVSQNEYMNEKRQRITVRSQAPVDFAAESRFLLEESSKMQTS